MFETLNDKLGSVFSKLGRKGALSEQDVTAAMREIRVALLEADVALPVVKDFVEQVREEAVGEKVLKSIKPDQQVVKIVNDKLTELLGAEKAELNLNVTPPAVILMAGLQGVGKTTTTGKLAKFLKDKQRKKVMVASLDVQRPAAQEQLKILAEQVGVENLPIVAGQQPVQIAKRAVEAARLQGFDVVILDTAGRLALNEELMNEVKDVRAATNPSETLLVTDAMMGQDAVQTAKAFHDALELTGIVLTRVDGDARGGAALSMKVVTGCPIKFSGTGEKLDALEEFHPERIAGRILGMGDVVGLVERASEAIDQDEAEKLAQKMQSGEFDMNDMLAQFKQVKKLSGMSGGLSGILGMIPGLPNMNKVKEQMKGANLDDSVITRQEAIILSMTPKERAKPALLKAKRKERVAKGSGTSVQDVNKLLKQFQQMQTMMKKMRKLGKKGMMQQMQNLMQQGGGMPQGPMGGGMPGGMPGGGLPGGFPFK